MLLWYVTVSDSATRWFTEVGAVSEQHCRHVHYDSDVPALYRPSDGSIFKNVIYSQDGDGEVDYLSSDGPVHNSSPGGSKHRSVYVRDGYAKNKDHQHCSYKDHQHSTYQGRRQYDEQITEGHEYLPVYQRSSQSQQEIPVDYWHGHQSVPRSDQRQQPHQHVYTAMPQSQQHFIYPGVPQSHPSVPQSHPGVPQSHQQVIVEHGKDQQHFIYPGVPQSHPSVPQLHPGVPQSQRQLTELEHHHRSSYGTTVQSDKDMLLDCNYAPLYQGASLYQGAQVYQGALDSQQHASVGEQHCLPVHRDQRRSDQFSEVVFQTDEDHQKLSIITDSRYQLTASNVQVCSLFCCLTCLSLLFALFTGRTAQRAALPVFFDFSSCMDDMLHQSR